MTKKKLETFKVAEKHAPRVKPSAGSGKEAAPAEEPKASLGFTRIEELLDTAAPGDVQRSLVDLTDRLDAYMSDAKGQKEKAQGRRAKVAVERTIDLLAYLFQTKEAMVQNLMQGATSKPPKKRGP